MITLIQSNDTDGLTEAAIHVAERREMRTMKTQKLMGVYYVPACGTRLSSSWGSSKREGDASEVTCARCAAHLNKQSN